MFFACFIAFIILCILLIVVHVVQLLIILSFYYITIIVHLFSNPGAEDFEDAAGRVSQNDIAFETLKRRQDNRYGILN